MAVAGVRIDTAPGLVLESHLHLMRTAERYTGSYGTSLRLDGLEPGFNDAVRSRAIVIHGATYSRLPAFLNHRCYRSGRSSDEREVNPIFNFPDAVITTHSLDAVLTEVYRIDRSVVSFTHQIVNQGVSHGVAFIRSPDDCDRCRPENLVQFVVHGTSILLFLSEAGLYRESKESDTFNLHLNLGGKFLSPPKGPTLSGNFPLPLNLSPTT